MLALSDFENKMLELLKSSSCRGKHSIRNAWNHLEKAIALQQIDPAMSAFRAITAEEEAATGLIFALQFRNYKDATKLDPRNHQHKHAIYPFIEVLSDFFSKTAGKAGIFPTLRIGDPPDQKLMKILIPLNVDGKDIWAAPYPPLEMTLKDQSGLIDFEQGIKALASSKNVSRISE
jgi:hypothetical protein